MKNNNKEKEAFGAGIAAGLFGLIALCIFSYGCYLLADSFVMFRVNKRANAINDARIQDFHTLEHRIYDLENNISRGKK